MALWKAQQYLYSRGFSMFTSKITKQLVETSNQLVERVELMERDIKKLADENSNMRKRLNVLEGLRERKESNEPWVELIGGDIDPNKGLEMSLDWNDAFIEQLRAKGYRGTTETALVAQWLLTVSNTVKPGDDT